MLPPADAAAGPGSDDCRRDGDQRSGARLGHDPEGVVILA